MASALLKLLSTVTNKQTNKQINKQTNKYTFAFHIMTSVLIVGC